MNLFVLDGNVEVGGEEGKVDARNVTSETDWVVVGPAEVEDSGIALFHYHLVLTLSLGISVLASLVLVTAVVYYIAFIWIPRRE